MPRNCRVRSARSLEAALETRESSLIRLKTIKNSDRTYAALYKLNSKLGFNVEPISVELALQTVQEQSVENNEALGPRYDRFVRLALGNLKKRSLTKDHDRDHRSKSSTKFIFNNCLIKLFKEAFLYGIRCQLYRLSQIDSYRATCGFLRLKLEYPTGKKPSARSAIQQIKQLEEENRELALRIAGQEQSSPAATGEDRDLQDESRSDLIEHQAEQLTAEKSTNAQNEFAARLEGVPRTQNDVERSGGHSPVPTEKVSHKFDLANLEDTLARLKGSQQLVQDAIIEKRAYSLDPTAEFYNDRPTMSDTNSMWAAEPALPPIVLPLKTPIRHSINLDNPKAYPTPESPLRPALTSRIPSQSSGGVETPSRNTGIAARKTRAQVP